MLRYTQKLELGRFSSKVYAKLNRWTGKPTGRSVESIRLSGSDEESEKYN